MIAHRIACAIHSYVIPAYDASLTICTDPAGLVLAGILILTGKH